MLLSLPLALFLATPVTMVLGRVLGELAFRIPLPLEVSWVGVIAWVVGALAISEVASVAPAKASVNQPVHKALTHV